MAENKKQGKGIGTVFIVLCLLVLAAAVVFSVYMGGQKKALTEYYTAIIRDDYSNVGKYFKDGILDDEAIASLSGEYNTFLEGFGLEGSSIMHVRVDFLKRTMPDISTVDYDYTVTYYDDDCKSDVSSPLTMRLVYESGKWKLTTLRPSGI